MPSVSKKQQRFFGMVHACQKTGKCASPEVKKTAGSISYKDADEFASTKHKGLPEKKKKKKKKKHMDVDEDVATFTYSTSPEMMARIRSQYVPQGFLPAGEVQRYLKTMTESVEPQIGLSFKNWFYQSENPDC
jgi:hypothetical protein